MQCPASQGSGGDSLAVPFRYPECVGMARSRASPEEARIMMPRKLAFVGTFAQVIAVPLPIQLLTDRRPTARGETRIRCM